MLGFFLYIPNVIAGFRKKVNTLFMEKYCKVASQPTTSISIHLMNTNRKRIIGACIQLASIQ